MKETLLSLLAGGIVGIIFTLLDFPLPAPGSIAGFMGIFGVWLGATLIKKYDKNN